MQPMLYPFARSGARVLCSLLLLAGLLICGRTMAATPPGTIIRSQAEASFVDEFNEQFLVTSNEVATLVQNVTGVRLETPQTRYGMNGTDIVFPHLLINSGNITASYTLTLTTKRLPDVPSSYGIEELTLYFDRAHNGMPDENEIVKGPVELAPGENVSLLIKAKVPDEDHNEVALFARVNRPECKYVSDESIQGRCLAVNRNTISRSKGVVYEVSQSADQQEAYIGDQVRTKLSFKRMEHRTYISYVEMDYQLPEELEYVDGSSKLCPYNLASWNDREIERKCKDIDPTFLPEGQQPQWLRYYVREKDRGTGIPSPGHEGQIFFKTRVTGGVSKTLYNVAEYTFQEVPLSGTIRQTTNYVPLKIKGFGVSLNASPLSSDAHIGEPQIVASAPSGGIVEFTNYLWNLGTEPTSFEVTLDAGQGANSLPFPPGSSYCLTKETECTDFSETPEALTFNEGDISPGTHQAVRLFVQLPDAGISYQNSYNLTLKAVDTSSEHTYEVTDSTRNMLVKITGSATNSMDLTFGQSLNDNANAPGEGPGPEAEHLDIQEGKPGTTLKFNPIYINNTGSQADNYKLELEPGSDGELPESFRWSFVNEFGQPIANSGTVPPNGNTRVQVWIELPPDYPSQSWSFNVLARSAVTGATDSLHLRLTVEAEEQILLAPNGQSQVSPGSFVTFVHQLTNAGNMPEDAISLTVQDSLAAQGWQSLVYLDSNGDGQISAGESPLQEQTIALAAGTTVNVLVKVFAPANAAQGSVNTSTLTAVFGENDGQSVSVIDTATANNAIVGITKTQILWNCKDTPPEPVSSHTFPVKPGECVVYKLLATNHGREAVQNVVIYDKAPDFTVFIEKTGDLPKVDHNGQHHISGQIINATWSQGLMPGQSVFLKFGIKVQ